jgi:hypothetical protein
VKTLATISRRLKVTLSYRLLPLYGRIEDASLPQLGKLLEITSKSAFHAARPENPPSG